MKTKTENLGKVSITVEKDFWNIDKAYDRLTIVEKQGTSTAYISRKAVPVGAPITDRNYWIPISKWAEIPYQEIDPVPTRYSTNSVQSGGVFDALQAQDAIEASFSDDGKIYYNYKAGDIFYIEQNGVHKYRVAYFNGTADEEHPVTIDGLHFYFANNAPDAIFKSTLIKNVSTVQQQLTYTQKSTARENIAAVAYEKQELTSNQQVQLQNNMIGKKYVPADFSGLGKKVFAKNVQTVGGVDKNIMTQAFFEDEQGNPLTNTVFVIQYDYDLNGQTITVPAGCTLQFDGGSVNNGTITLNNTKIKADHKVFQNITIDGSCGDDRVYSKWFDLNNVSAEICTSTVRAMFAGNAKEVVFESGTYNLHQVTLHQSVSIIGEGNPVFVAQPRVSGYAGCDRIFYGKNIDYVNIDGIEITGDTSLLPLLYQNINLPLLTFDTVTKVNVNNVFFNNCHLKKVEINGAEWEYGTNPIVLVLCDDCTDVFVTNCEIDGCYGGELIYVTHTSKNREDINLVFSDNYIHNITNPIGNTPLTCESANHVTCTNNRVENYKLDMSIFNLFGIYVYINNNIITDSQTSTVFDISEWGQNDAEHCSRSVIATNNYVECKNSIFLLPASVNLVVKDNFHKGVSLLYSNCEALLTNYLNDKIMFQIENNYEDSTYYDLDFIPESKIGKPFFNSIYISCQRTGIYKIAGNYIHHITDANVNTNDANVNYNNLPIKIRWTMPNSNYIIKSNTIKGVFPGCGSGVYKRVILMAANSNDRQIIDSVEYSDNKIMSEENVNQYYLHDLFINVYYGSNAEIITSMNCFNNSRFIKKDNSELYDFFDVAVIDFPKGVVKNLFADRFYLTEGTVYRYTGMNVANYTHRAYMSMEINSSLNTIYVPLQSTCVTDKVATDGMTATAGNVYQVNNKNFMLVYPQSVTLTTSIINSLDSDTSSTEDIVNVSDVLFVRCIGRRNTIVNLKTAIGGSSRPTLNSTSDVGKSFFDTILGKPIYWNGTAWVDATGATV